ncbi:MAG: hypothetical protein JXQ73_05525 [Phycisphaerae bacterium]|nr:hypothetical protein [Phycisphaerae bacterium]
MASWLCGSILLIAFATTFSDDFESDLSPQWQVVSGSPKRAADPDSPDRLVLELGSSSKLMLRLDPPMRDFVIEARVRFAEDRKWVEAPFLLRSDETGNQAIQVYLEQKSDRIIAMRYQDGVHHLAAALCPARLEIGPWYRVKVAAVGDRIGAWVDGKLALGFRDDSPRAGCVGLRVGDARTYYDDVCVRPPNEQERATLGRIQFPGRPRAEMIESVYSFPDGSQVVLRCPDVVEPLTPFDVLMEEKGHTQPAEYLLIVEQQSIPLTPGKPLRLTLSGREGDRTFRLMRNARPVGTARVRVQAATFFEAGPFTALFDKLQHRVSRDRHPWRRKGRVFHANPTWFRDHVHEMKAYKFWEHDLSSFVDELIELQHPEGFYYEIIGPADHDHQTFVSEKHRLIEKDQNLCWIRLEMEADVEYLMVEAVYALWKATGDLRALRKRLPSLDRALEYDFTHPTRWDSKHGALKRTFSIDTWDFTYGISDQNRKIEPGMPMGIMHGDNSGLYAACRQLAEMYRAVGESAKADEWDRKAADLRERINKLCWNGRFYTHQILLQPVDTGASEEEILSLSNTYDINRDLPTHDMAVKIIDEYQARRKRHADTHFAEWYAIDPPYPQFGPYPAGRYINGGIAGFVAGELAKAALNHGREAYGADILLRVAKRVARDGYIGFLYDAKGKDMGGGPQGWSAAAVISALIEGLAGIRDDSTLFHRATISPRFLAAGIDKARVCARYGPSGAYVTLAYEHAPADKTIRLRLAGVSEHAAVRLLLPEGALHADVVEPKGVSSKIETVEASRYVCLPFPRPLSTGVADVLVRYGD